MGKYEPLQQHLAAANQAELRISFKDIESILGFPLPRSAYRYPAWWSNDAQGHSHSRAWLDAGWKTEQVDVSGGKLTFRKHHANAPGRPTRPSLFGGLKGTIKVMPGVDLTAPVGEIWAAQEGKLDE